MPNARHSRRIQQLSSERDVEDDIDRRGTEHRRSNSAANPNEEGNAEMHAANLDLLHRTYLAHRGQLPDVTTNEYQEENAAPGSISAATSRHEGECVSTDNKRITTTDIHAIREQVSTLCNNVGGASSSSGPSSGVLAHILGPAVAAAVAADTDSDQPLRQSPVPAKVTVSNNPPRSSGPILLPPNNEDNVSTRSEVLRRPPNRKRTRRRITKQGKGSSDEADDNPEFRIPGPKRKHHGLGYEFPDSDNQIPTSETGSLLDVEALENMHDRLHTKVRKQQRRKESIHETSGNEVQKGHDPDSSNNNVSSSDDNTFGNNLPTPTPKPPKKDKEVVAPPPTLKEIENNRRKLHAGALQVSEQMCKALDDIDTLRAEALQGILNSLRGAYEAKATEKRRVPMRKQWPEYPSNRYHLSDFMEQDTRGALLEA
ncbi:hypothetical protein SARC_02823 [Sphaeroforma arctica JP610]|uniref:Uncharacterized protein n=1 Tax=Sphaeroforma arctica JP610 TaxID=667725 RepID=A0A0L0G9M5_9EUKA|nr:hypothetical protein SARC_02823 [Sphaeroforma arctica JP610]KNC84968.1 hypothetical protein SARC_02823 [Sphaeroforma arctica JP610]|eukprot:XP_014158870.1 hypothetical protein SARC_02823 [Sphaeroforma arctica JP610]